MIQEELSVEDSSNDERVHSSKHMGKGLILKAIIVVLFLAFASKAVWPMITAEKSQQTTVSTEKLMDHLEVRELLE